ncbi:hypothetical protein Tcan_06040 [Toxocara canis]|uniref:Uncharacterized protein n=1 Tax=Toxocara canis TaxID=6265 RepID=A0A0B2V6A7_TOXCA|nr:hypothetical protein Tcan_06040 [Toxocara canis]
MKRSRTVETSVSSIPSSHNQSPSDEKGSRRQRWSFAFHRRWFSSTSSSSRGNERSVSEDVLDDANYIGAPARTTLGRSRFDGVAASCSTDRPLVDPSSPSVSQNIVKRKSIRLDRLNWNGMAVSQHKFQ